jgi:hypothetical protein
VSTFRVVRRVPRIVYDEVEVLATDDWLEAEAKVSEWLRHHPNTMQMRELPEVRGVHPSHDFPPPGKGNPTCRNEGCRSWNNGSYGSHAPCGFDFEGKSLHTLIEERKARA